MRARAPLPAGRAARAGHPPRGFLGSGAAPSAAAPSLGALKASSAACCAAACFCRCSSSGSRADQRAAARLRLHTRATKQHEQAAAAGCGSSKLPAAATCQRLGVKQPVSFVRGRGKVHAASQPSPGSERCCTAARGGWCCCLMRARGGRWCSLLEQQLCAGGNHKPCKCASTCCTNAQMYTEPVLSCRHCRIRLLAGSQRKRLRGGTSGGHQRLWM